MGRWAIVGVLAAAAVACNTSTPSEQITPTSGVRGTVVYGPNCPVVMLNSPCPDRPWQGIVQASEPGGSVVGSTHTDRTGTFLLPLASGTYDVTPVTPEGPPTAKERQVTVTEGSFVTVSLQVDSGIR
jgi:hypothetical protein